MIIEARRVVSIHYRLTNSAGEELDSSKGKDPLNYLHGSKNIIAGLESALNGKTAGDELKVTVPPEEGYGPVQDSLIQKVPRKVFQDVDDIKPGMQFQARGQDGHAQIIKVVGVEGEDVTVDGNHPLAGEVLHFEVKVEQVREATQEEIDHGHVHDGSHHH